MAVDTPLSYRNLVIYEVYVRNHGPNGTFLDVENDLERIKRMGVDIVWFMPIHPIGQLNKKGTLGCPYSIQDYREVNPEYGTKADFKRLIDKTHQLGMKVMIDVVYNHTSHDSVLVRQHPEWFHQDTYGTPVTTVPDWSDVIDLKHPQPGLTEYLIETLQMWAEFGVDGFRCDVASLLPLEFWATARREVAKVKPGVIWLAESVHAGFIEHRRSKGLSGLSDSELFSAFDMAYDYDIWTLFQAAVLGKIPVNRYLEALRFQHAIYPANFVKMRCAENHDQRRIMGITKNREHAIAWTAFQAFLPGSFLIYGGEDSGASHTPSLFDIDKIDWGNYPLQGFLTSLSLLKKSLIVRQGSWVVSSTVPAAIAIWSNSSASLVGVFNLNQLSGRVDVPLADGRYLDILTHEEVEVREHQLEIPRSAIILEVSSPIEARPEYCDLLDFTLPAA